LSRLISQFDPATGEIAGIAPVSRRLSDLRGCFADAAAYDAALAKGDPVVYTVATADSPAGPGDLCLGVGRLMPGRIGREYFLTKGHMHSWREAAELYIGLSGEGMMLLEDYRSGESRTAALLPNHAVYVPGHAAHRTINTGSAPLTYIGVYPAGAGHDYAVIKERNFRQVVVEHEGRPAVCDRSDLLAGRASPGPGAPRPNPLF
jgi:glucose-6-phosphate isomerase